MMKWVGINDLAATQCVSAGRVAHNELVTVQGHTWASEVDLGEGGLSAAECILIE